VYECPRSKLQPAGVVSAIESKVQKGPEGIEMLNMSKAVKRIAMVAAFGMAATVGSFAQDWHDVRNDRNDVRREQVDIRQDYNKLRRDQYRHDWQAVRRDQADIARDQAEIRNQRNDIRHDRDRDRYEHRW
jgi:hypothetical protein